MACFPVPSTNMPFLPNLNFKHNLQTYRRSFLSSPDPYRNSSSSSMLLRFLKSSLTLSSFLNASRNFFDSICSSNALVSNFSVLLPLLCFFFLSWSSRSLFFFLLFSLSRDFLSFLFFFLDFSSSAFRSFFLEKMGSRSFYAPHTKLPTAMTWQTHHRGLVISSLKNLKIVSV